MHAAPSCSARRTNSEPDLLLSHVLKFLHFPSHNPLFTLLQHFSTYFHTCGGSVDSVHVSVLSRTFRLFLSRYNSPFGHVGPSP